MKIHISLWGPDIYTVSVCVSRIVLYSVHYEENLFILDIEYLHKFLGPEIYNVIVCPELWYF